MVDVTIILERTVDRISEGYTYDPTAPYAKPKFYAHIMNDDSDVPTEFEVRVYGSEDDETLIITPRQLNEEGDLNFPWEALQLAVDQIQRRTEENLRAREAQVSGEARSTVVFDEDNEVGS